MARIDILKESLRKKEQAFSDKLTAHIETVKQANGQPLNDKRNGQATLNKWDKQNNTLITLDKGIEKTKEAIEREETKIRGCEAVKEGFPVEILNLVESKVLTQWRKHPTIFFVDGVEKARIIWDEKSKNVLARYATSIPTKEQYAKYASIFNTLRKVLTPSTNQ